MSNTSASAPAADLPIGFADVAAAAGRLRGVAHRTPARTSRTVDEACGASVYFKCENFQRMGAFKFRGAYNALARFNAEQRRAGVIAFSSGNHAQAIALSARLLGMPSRLPAGPARQRGRPLRPLHAGPRGDRPAHRRRARDDADPAL
jgi:threonine dehydratase